eukprot:TRINITY_DN214_c0_g3_i1.p1 TRINITY_DN214_c0_g3~~TRINITY_DN214_c0_g3_i1.p1  ORF type:complete len:176 (-),score=76.22 TRINITY_DN214_c0_g3_i1:119-646(-)
MSTLHSQQQQQQQQSFKSLTNLKLVIGNRSYLTQELKLGHGSNSFVRLGIDCSTNDPVAIKFIRINSDSRAIKEADFLRRLQGHPNVVNLIACCDCTLFTQQYTCLVLELGQQNLAQLLENVGKLEENIVKLIFRQIVSAVAHCHKNSISHHDLKLENFIIALNNNHNNNNNDNV